MTTLGQLTVVRRLAISSAVVDRALLLIATLSAALGSGAVGLYSDDWPWVAQLALNPERGFGQQFSAFNQAFENSRNRPFQGIEAIGLYTLFGINPLAFQICNALVLALGSLLFYQVLRSLALPQPFALAIPLVYSLLPHYSSARYWYSAYPVGSSVTLFFLALYADVRLSAAQHSRWRWQLLGVGALLISAGAYELALPLFVCGPLLFAVLTRRTAPQQALAWRWITLRNALLVGLVIAAKLLTTNRIERYPLTDQLEWFGNLLGQAVRLSTLGEYGLRLPLVLNQIWQQPGGHTLFLIAGLLGALACVALLQPEHRAPEMASRRLALGIMLIGALTFGAGYAIFLTGHLAAISAAGLHNRTAIAAAIGVALLLVGAVGWATSWLPAGWPQRAGFAGALGLCCAAYLAVDLSIASFWVAANQRQQAILANIQTQVPALPADRVLLLANFCPYVGPAPVFEAYWDISGALQIQRHSAALRADVVTPELQLTDTAAVTTIYDDENSYPYQNLGLYRANQRQFEPLTAAATTRPLLQRAVAEQQAACPAARPGYGAPIWQRVQP